MLRKDDTLYGIIDVYTDEWATYQKVTVNRQGQPITDADADGVIIRKLATGEFFKIVVTSGTCISVRRWGAVGDGVADDTTAVQTALTLCSQYRIGLYFDGIFKITSGITVPAGLPKMEFPAPMFGNSGSSTYGIKPDTSLSTGWTAVTFALGLTAFECKNLTVHGNADTASPTVVHGVEFLGSAGLNNVSNMRVYNLLGRGIKINKLYDSVFTNTSVERCGTPSTVIGSTVTDGEYAFSVLESGDTSNHTIFNRLQVELSRGKAMYFGDNNLNLLVTDIHSERCSNPISGYSAYLSGAACTYINARIEGNTTANADKIFCGGSGNTFQDFRCTDGTIETTSGNNEVMLKLNDFIVSNLKVKTGGNPYVTFENLNVTGTFTVDAQPRVLVQGLSRINHVALSSNAAKCVIQNAYIYGSFSNLGGNNEVTLIDCTLPTSFPPFKFTNLIRCTVTPDVALGTSQIVTARETTFSGDVAMNLQLSLFYGYGCTFVGNLTYSGSGNSYGILDADCVCQGSVNSRYYGQPIDLFWTIGTIRWTPFPNLGDPIAYRCQREGYASTSIWTANTVILVGQIVYYGNNVYQNASTSNGTTSYSPPTFTSGTQTDGTVVWMYLGQRALWKPYGIASRQDVKVTSALVVTVVDDYETYVFTGTTSTVAIPAVSGTSKTKFFFKNRGSGTVTLHCTGSSFELYTTAAVYTVTIAAGDGLMILSDGTYWNVVAEASVLPLEYVALITQSSTGNPTTTELQNDFGIISWIRYSVGVYRSTNAALIAAIEAGTAQLETVLIFQKVDLEDYVNFELSTELDTGITYAVLYSKIAVAPTDGGFFDTLIKIKNY